MVSFVCHLDESVPDDASLIAIAGFMSDAARLQELAERWRVLRTEVFQIDPEAELKYTLHENHPTRNALDENGWNQAERVPAMLKAVRDLDLTIIGDVVHPVKDGLSPRALYLDGFSWCIRRHMNDVGYAQGPHWVVIDYPPEPGDLEGASNRIKELYASVGTAAFDRYKKLYWEDEEMAGGDPAAALRERGFIPELVAAHAKHSDLLQIADVIAGCFRDFTQYNLVNSADDGELPQPTWRDDNLAIIAPDIRRSPTGSVKGWGFDLFPDDHPARNPIVERVDELANA